MDDRNRFGLENRLLTVGSNPRERGIGRRQQQKQRYDYRYLRVLVVLVQGTGLGKKSTSEVGIRREFRILGDDQCVVVVTDGTTQDGGREEHQQGYNVESNHVVCFVFWFRRLLCSRSIVQQESDSLSQSKERKSFVGYDDVW